jgi:hypothetical protein
VLAARLVVRGSSVLGVKFSGMIGQIREAVKDDSYSRRIDTVNGLRFGHANACCPAMSGVKSDQPCAPACVTLSQLSMIGRVTPAAGVPYFSKQPPRPSAVASEIGQNRTNASQHVGAEYRDKPQAPQVPAVQNSTIMHYAGKHCYIRLNRSF